jgi:signal transduction histidine kinase/ligand-binding sensor domain-containing protein
VFARLRFRRALAIVVVALAAGDLARPAPALALDPAKTLSECTVDVFGARDGLTGAQVRAITQTRDGYLWIGGSGGVRRYDGARVQHMEIDPPINVIGMAVSGSNTLVAAIGPRGAPVCTVRGRLAKCGGEQPMMSPDARVFAMSSDSEGNVWMAAEEGLQRLSPDGKLTLHSPPQRMPRAEITVVARDRARQLWLGTLDGLFVDRGGGTFERHAAANRATRAPVRSLFASASGQMLVLTDELLMRVSGEEVDVFPQRAVPAGWRTQMIEDRDGNVWIGSHAGLIRFRQGAFVLFTKRDGLPDDDVTTVFEDREGSLWVGTRSGSLAQFTDRTVPSNAGPPSLRELPIETVCEDGIGAMWFGSWRGLTRWKDGEEKTYTRTDGLPADHVMAVYPASRTGGDLWVGTLDGLARWRNAKVESLILPGARVMSLYVDRSETLWIGTSTTLFRYRSGRLSEVPTEKGLRPGEIRGIAEDDRGTVWVTTAAAGLTAVENGRLVLASSVEPVATRADRGMLREPDGTMWFGAMGTLVRRRGGQFQTYGPDEGVPPDPIFQLLPDDYGFLWMGTSRGIVRIAKASLTGVSAGVGVGVGPLDVPGQGGTPGRAPAPAGGPLPAVGQEPVPIEVQGETAPQGVAPAVAPSQRQRVAPVSLDMSDQRREIAARRSRTPGAWKASDGRLWFATLRGVLTVDPTRVRTNAVMPPVRIEQAMVDGRAAERGRPNVFPPGPGHLEFHFGAITLVDPQKAVHRYRLEGFDKEWVDAGPRRVAYYTNIPPGRYVFRVQASNADGVWNEAGATLELHLAPHFYQTMWFYVLTGLFVLAVGFSLHRLRVARLRVQYLAVFNERGRVARELHDSLLQGMSAVAIQIRSVRKRLTTAATAGGAGGGTLPRPEQLNEDLRAIEQVVAANVEDTRQFVWNLRDPMSNAGDLGAAISHLARRLTEPPGIECRVDVTGEVVPLQRDLQYDLFRIAQEALVNAVKHAKAKHIVVSLCYEEQGVRLTVKDDGCGFDPQNAPGAQAGHFGLIGMRERARRMGDLTIESAPGLGTTVELRVKGDGGEKADDQ